MADNIHESKTLTFIQDTSFNRDTIRAIKRPEYESSETFKNYPGSSKITLPRTAWELTEARIIPLLQKRRSARKFKKKSLKLTELAFILWGAQGITAQAGHHFFRTAPSAGALYPVESYLVIQNISDVDPGVYHFDVRSFQLELLEDGLFENQVSAAFLDQDFMRDAAFNIIWTAVARRTMSKYGERGGRYLLLDTAHICQNTIIAAEAVIAAVARLRLFTMMKYAACSI